MNIHLTRENCVIFFFKGGPGATSLYGLFKENGPIKAYTVSDNQFHAANNKNVNKSNGTSSSHHQKRNKRSVSSFFEEYLKTPQQFPLYDRYTPKSELNRFSWNRNASVLYIDNPVGTGFSFTDHKDGYPNYVNQSSEDLFHALQQFFQLFNEYKDR